MGHGMEFGHQPVLMREVVGFLVTRPGGCYIDGTVGGGGHAAALLESGEAVRVLGIDRDEDAVAAARERLARFGERAQVRRGVFSEMGSLAAEAGWSSVDGVLLDVGVSSHQIDTPGRGFSHRSDAPLDMRMDRRLPVTAAMLLNRSPEDELARIFREYGEERQARRLARAVVERRAQRAWERTAELAELAERVVGRHGSSGLPPATRCFQALRIAVNDELGELGRALPEAVRLLRPGARLAAISFHSLEDRLVKRFFLREAAECVCPPGLPVCCCDKRASLRVLTRRPVRPSAEEEARNPRSASAHLRVAERVVPSGPKNRQGALARVAPGDDASE